VIISRSPLRLSFFGGGTDYPDYFLRKPGAVLGTTIDKYILVTINRGSPFFEHRIRVSYAKAEAVRRVEEIEHPSVRAVLQELKLDDMLDIHIFADLPARTGLGSSSAFTVAFLNACYAYQGKFVGRRALADQAIYIEQEILKENVGIQDQLHSALGGFNIIRADSQGIRVSPVILSRENRQLLEDSLMLFYTRITRLASEVVAEQLDNTRRREIDDQLERMAAQVDEAQEVLSAQRGRKLLKNFGALLHEAWSLKKQLSSKISNSTIDQYYEAALKHGALGGKVGGAGSGGFLMLLVEKKHQSAVRAALRGLDEVDFRFESDGASIIYSHDPPQYIPAR
jgi:Predicted kinase related to galactokinase and mevalonate kinase